MATVTAVTQHIAVITACTSDGAFHDNALVSVNLATQCGLGGKDGPKDSTYRQSTRSSFIFSLAVAVRVLVTCR